MSNERRSAFSRAVRSINPVPSVPDVAVLHYQLQLALVERDKARADVAELRAAIQDYVDWGAMTGSDRDMLEFRFRALLAKLDTEGK